MRAAKIGIAALDFNNGLDQITIWAFRPGFLPWWEENNLEYFLLTSALWNKRKAEGLIMMADRAIRLGDSIIANHWKMNRSMVVRFGAFNLEHWIAKSCFFSTKFSAATAFTPLGCSWRTSTVTKWMTSRRIIDGTQSITRLRIQLELWQTTNSPGTGALVVK